MTHLTRRHALQALASLAAGGLGATSGTAFAQAYPERTIRIIVPFAAGGGSDITARAIAEKLTEKLKQPVVVENRTGAGGSLGANMVARAAPDGYTLLLGSNSEIVQYPNVKADVPYDPVRDFAPVGLVAMVPLALVVTNALPVKTVAELIEHARKNPNALNYGSAGPGSATHLAMALFTSMTGTQMTHVPYRGSAPVVNDLLAGNLQLAMPTLSAALPHAGGGKVRVLATSMATRAAALPDVPTVAEGGVAGYSAALWTGLLAPAGTAPAVVAQLNAAVAEALAAPDFKETLARQGAEPTGGSAEHFAAEIRRELAVWKDVAQKTGIRID